jgi:glycolate oxidase iron-sulfur subunit
MDAIFHRINQLSIRLLAEAGCDVIVVPKQTCCGALHAHAGELEQARELAKLNIEAFEKIKADFIVNNAGGCGAMLAEYGHLLSHDKEWRERAAAFSAKSKDISQILVECELPAMSPRENERVTYQPSCHMTNVQKVTKEPLELLKRVPGIHFAAMEQEQMCCGSAGIYNIVHYDASMQILDEKMKHAKKTNPAVIITTNPGCLLQMKLGVEREGLTESVRALHLVEYLAEAAGLLVENDI